MRLKCCRIRWAEVDQVNIAATSIWGTSDAKFAAAWWVTGAANGVGPTNRWSSLLYGGKIRLAGTT